MEVMSRLWVATLLVGVIMGFAPVTIIGVIDRGVPSPALYTLAAMMVIVVITFAWHSEGLDPLILGEFEAEWQMMVMVISFTINIVLVSGVPFPLDNGADLTDEAITKIMWTMFAWACSPLIGIPMLVSYAVFRLAYRLVYWLIPMSPTGV